jgi:hypothetical protein
MLDEGQLHRLELTAKPVTEINPASRVTWLQSMNYSRTAELQAASSL